MLLGVARAADAEVVPAGDQLDQLAAIREAACCGRESLGAVGRISAQREDVVDPGATQALEDLVQIVDGSVDAGQVGHRLDVELTPDPGDQVDRARAHRPSGAIGDRHEGRLELAQVGDRLEELRHALVGLRREELKREHGLPASFQDRVEAHGEHMLRSEKCLRRMHRQSAATIPSPT